MAGLELNSLDAPLTEDFWLDRPVLVTGGTGLVGGWLVASLLRNRANVVCLIRDDAPDCVLVRSGDIRRVVVVRGDVRDQELMERVIGEYEIDTVFHLAAQTIVGVANRNPVSTLDTNVRGTWVLLEACRRSPLIHQVVVASSDKAYGTAEPMCTEDARLAGDHPYDVSKSCADLITSAYARTYDLRVVITRCGNFYGGGDLNWNRLVPGTIRSALRGRAPLIRSDGTPLRDYFYVEDGAAAYMRAAETLARRPELAGQAFNFSNEQPLSVIAMTRRILALMESDLEPRVLAEARHEIPEQSLSAAKARRELGWVPQWDLDGGLRRTVDWYHDYLALTGPRPASLRVLASTREL
jgi:CDP-glucose 4,6-dehydratase